MSNQHSYKVLKVGESITGTVHRVIYINRPVITCNTVELVVDGGVTPIRATADLCRSVSALSNGKSTPPRIKITCTHEEKQGNGTHKRCYDAFLFPEVPGKNAP